MKSIVPIFVLLFCLFCNSGIAQNCGRPSGLRVAGPTSGAASLVWDAVPGATMYTLEVTGDKNPYSFVVTFPAPSSGSMVVYSIADLSPCNRYRFRVQATCASGTSNWSSSRGFKTNCRL